MVNKKLKNLIKKIIEIENKEKFHRELKKIKIEINNLNYKSKNEIIDYLFNEANKYYKKYSNNKYNKNISQSKKFEPADDIIY